MLDRVAYSLHGIGLFQFASGATTLGWAFILLVLNPDMLVSGHIYTAMAQLTPAWVWGLACLMVGLIQLAAVLFVRPVLMTFGSTLGALFFWTVSGSFFAVTNTTTGGITYGVLGCCNAISAIVYWRAR